MDKFVIRTITSSNEKSNEKRKNTETAKQEQNKKIREDFDPNWLRIYPWLEQNRDSDGKVTMFCSWCKNLKKKNIFTMGTQSYRKQTLERHIEIDDHKLATIAKDKSQTSIIQGFT
jgi:hypothetical protein